MSDLISRSALLAAVQAGEHTTDTIVQIEAAPSIKPQVVANITGGVLQGASADYPVDVYVLDFDCNDDAGIEIDGDTAWLGQHSAKIEPDFVQRVIEA